jgi:hypothetical protein
MKSDYAMFELTIEADDMIIITNPRGKKIVIEHIEGKLEFHGRSTKPEGFEMRQTVVK